MCVRFHSHRDLENQSKPCSGIDWAKGWLDTPHGRISVSLKFVDGRQVLEYSVPKGVDVTVARKAER